jgi:nitrogen fixation protein FixH
MTLSSGKLWPYIIGGSIILVFGACVMTIVVTSKMPVEKSDTYMMGYQEADAKANDIIEAQIAFNTKYRASYVSSELKKENTTLTYKVETIDGQPVNDAKITIVVTRPNKHEFDQELQNPTVANGIYTFSNISLPKEGRWDVMAKIDVADNHRFLNIKADTRYKNIEEY